jgi:hypothetical protein
MTRRAPLLLSAIALAVSLLGPATVGHAAGSAARPVERALFAYRAGHSRYAKDAVHATRADRAGVARRAATAASAANALAVNGIQASRTPTPNMLLPLDASGKLPASIGAVGPVGPKGAAGPAGPAGPAGISGLQLVTADSGANSNTVKSQSVSCPSGKKVLGGGASVSTTSNTLAITRSSPASDLSGWSAEAQETAAFAGNWRVSVYAICATVAA